MSLASAEAQNMASKPLTLIVRPRGKPISTLPEEVLTSTTDNASHLYSKIASLSHFSIHRLRITKGSDGSYIPKDRALLIAHTGLRDKSTIYVKDLGPQISWRVVFIIEYLGPLLIHPLIYSLRNHIYPSGKPGAPATQAQTLTLALVTLHFLKREYETVFVHRFSNATMPAFNIFKNSSHYWFLAGFLIAAFVYWPNSNSAAAAAETIAPLRLYAGLALFAFGEIANFQAHLTLRGLRSSGGTERGIPRGFGFNLVTCPNYLFEITAWVGVLLISWHWSVAVFLLVGGVQMSLWAKKKESRYRKEFGDKYKRKRFALIPGLV